MADKKPKLKIKNSPLTPLLPQTSSTKKKRVVKELPTENKEGVLIIISQTTYYKIGWIAIRRTINKFSNLFRRKQKPKKIGLWRKYTNWFNLKFNTEALPSDRLPTDNNESLYEILRSEK